MILSQRGIELFFVCMISIFQLWLRLYLYDQIISLDFFVWKRHQTKTVLTARTGRIAHNDRLLRVRMCEPRYITTKAAIVLKFVSIRIDGSTIGKWDILKKDWFTELPNPPELLEYDKAVL